MGQGESTKFTPVTLERELGRGATSVAFEGRRGDERLLVKRGHRPRDAAVLAWEAFCLSVLGRRAEIGVATQRGDQLEGSSASDAAACLVTDLHVGEPLRADGPARPEDLAGAIAAELALAHAAGLAHGDVKPENVIVSPTGEGHLVDWGLAGWADDVNVTGATPRYLAHGDQTLGDGRARDLLALGLLLVELQDPKVRTSTDPLRLARIRPVVAPLDALCRALLVPSPWARPDARWVATQSSKTDPSSFHGAVVRATHLRLRHPHLGHAEHVEGDIAAWIAPVLEAARRGRAACTQLDTSPPKALRLRDGVLRPLDADARRRWLVTLAGPSAAAWPSMGSDMSEDRFAATLEVLAERIPPAEWTLPVVEAALTGSVPAAAPASVGPLLPDDVAELSLAVASSPPSSRALRRIESCADSVPTALRRAAADALRLAGELGRARALLARGGDAEAVAAEILRRSGDLEEASTVAERALRDRPDPRLRACRARIALDRGDPSLGLALGDEPPSAAEAEVAALARAAVGERHRAIRLARRTQALAQTHEARARAAATLAYIVDDADPVLAGRGWREAVEHAVRAGAILEEATYRTGEAANAVYRGHLDRADETAARAALLWDDVLQRPERAARAWLARAAARAAIDDGAGARFHAEQAIARAHRGGDARAAAYAQWAIADAIPAGDPDGAEAVELSAQLLVDPTADERVHLAARRLRVGGTDHPRPPLDDASVHARLTYWGARATRSLEGDGADEEVIAALLALADAPAPAPARGKAMSAGANLAARRGLTDALDRFEKVRRGAAEIVLGHTTRRALAPAVATCVWVRGRDDAPSLSDEQAIDLQQLVRALSERESLDILLGRVLDLLLLWTGAERGLMLLCEADERLVPRAARNIARDDLEAEQLELSTTLARRAVERGEPVVAVDAMAELSQAHTSVHALRLRSVLALPLVGQGEVVGVAYLDDRMRRAAFGRRELTWAQAIAPVAALAVTDARAQQRLRDAVSVAETTQRRLEVALAERESALDVASRELARARPTGGAFAAIIGRSDALERTLRLVERVAPSDVPVLLLGESGSGKELVARALHDASPRVRHPFVGENCGALPETLLESALFGHVKGAFTGAHRPRIGLFEAADGGTLFLDEIGEMSLGMQTKLLRVLEDSMVRPVGATAAKKVDVRIIAATHRNLDAMVREGSFREDLFYRLDVIGIPIPPLRERTGDVELLVSHFLHKHAQGRELRVTTRALQRLQRFPWPGNVRQLENEVRRALLLADDVIDIDHLSVDDREAPIGSPGSFDLKERIDQLERELVGQALERTHGNQTQAAKLLGISRYGLHKMIKRLEIPVPGRDT